LKSDSDVRVIVTDAGNKPSRSSRLFGTSASVTEGMTLGTAALQGAVYAVLTIV
jgi:hypothetical protein